MAAYFSQFCRGRAVDQRLLVLAALQRLVDVRRLLRHEDHRQVQFLDRGHGLGEGLGLAAHVCHGDDVGSDVGAHPDELQLSDGLDAGGKLAVD